MPRGKLSAPPSRSPAIPWCVRRRSSVSHNHSGILVPGGFGIRGTEGMILAAKWAREKNVPYLGICLGFQIAVIEFARNVMGLTGELL